MVRDHSVLSPQSSALAVRPAEPEEMADFSRIVALSLAMDPHSWETLRPEWTLCAFDEGKLATCYAAWPMTMRLDGAPVAVAAVTTVSTAPLSRRRGHLRAVMETDFRRMHEMEGPAIAILHASLAAIYQRYGYAIVSTHHSYRIEPRYLAFALPAQIRGTLRELTRQDGGLLNDVYRRYRDPRTGVLHRSRAQWAAGSLADPPTGHTLSIIAYEEDGETLGYIVYTTGPGSAPPPEPSQELRVRDLAWLTPAAYRALVEHLARFDLVGATVWPTMPADDPLPHLLQEPRMLRDTARDGILGRVVDLPRALPARPYGAAASLTFEVLDDMCPWNAGRWRLETDGRASEVRRETAEPQVSMPVTTLALLLFGQISATDAARMGRLDAHDPDALPLWDATLRTRYRPFCGDAF